jgi:hypothetical protein
MSRGQRQQFAAAHLGRCPIALLVELDCGAELAVSLYCAGLYRVCLFHAHGNKKGRAA